MSVRCLKTGCRKTWERDPVLEVECPVCGAGVGEKCHHLSPSGHKKSAAFQGLPPWGHDERDLVALEAGAYGDCPIERCPSPEDADRMRVRWRRKQKRDTREVTTEQQEMFA